MAWIPETIEKAGAWPCSRTHTGRQLFAFILVENPREAMAYISQLFTGILPRS